MNTPWAHFHFSKIAQAVRDIYPLTDADLILAERPERIHSVWNPLEIILDEIMDTGMVSEKDGQPVFVSEDRMFELIPAIEEVIELYDLLRSHHGISVDMSPLALFTRKLRNDTLLFETDIDACRACIDRCKLAIANITLQEAINMVNIIKERRDFPHNDPVPLAA